MGSGLLSRSLWGESGGCRALLMGEMHPCSCGLYGGRDDVVVWVGEGGVGVVGPGSGEGGCVGRVGGYGGGGVVALGSEERGCWVGVFDLGV